MLLHHRLGNIGLIGLLREELQRDAERFQTLLTRVLYNGIHSGDCLPAEMILKLRKELEDISNFKCSTKEADAFMREFQRKMSELVSASLSVKKPIAF
jgi:hypothetical protein